MTVLPKLPIEAAPIAVYRDLEIDRVRALLDEALAGNPLGAYDQHIVPWLKKTDEPTIASIILRARQQGIGPDAGAN